MAEVEPNNDGSPPVLAYSRDRGVAHSGKLLARLITGFVAIGCAVGLVTIDRWGFGWAVWLLVAAGSIVSQFAKQFGRKYRPWLVALAVVSALGFYCAWDTRPQPNSDVHALLACEKQLREIGMALSQYAYDHKGAYPDTLDDLVRSNLLDTKIMDQAKCYVYCRPEATRPDLTKGQDVLLVWEPLERHRTGAHLLFLHGSVVWITAKEFGWWASAGYSTTMPSR